MAWFVVLSLIAPPQNYRFRVVSVTIKVTRDVPIELFPSTLIERRGVLYFNRTTQRGAVVKKGQTFQMTRLNPEEQCRIRFAEIDYDLMSCPWLEGYVDHQLDIFIVVPEKNAPPQSK